MLEPIVDLAQVRALPGPVVFADARFYLDGRSAEAAYEAGHVPGAVFVSIEHDLAEPGRPPIDGRHPMPSPDAFTRALARRGISDTDTVIAYDDANGGTAGRLVVMLRAIGVDAALLDGGLAAWDGPLDTGPPPERPTGTFAVRPWPADRFASIDETAAAAAGGTTVVLDARAADRFVGDTEPVDPKAGHIPGARNAPWGAALDTEGRFRSPAALRSHFEALGVGDDVICYCGSGVSACADVLAIERAGFRAPRLFVGSWSAWSNDPDRPVATGPA